MSKTIIKALYEKGIFRPLTPSEIKLAEGQIVKLEVETKETVEDILKLATQVYEGLSENEIEEIENISKRQEKFFSNREV
ncbi:MAG: antitoxin AF2212-like protein [Blastocatellia bacterium]